MQKSKEAYSTNADSTPQLEATKLVVLDDAEGASSSPDDHTKQFKLLINQDYAQDIQLRKQFSWATYGLLCVWMLIVAGLIIWSSRSDELMIALVSGATIQVIGLYYIVLRYIFPSRNGSDRDTE